METKRESGIQQVFRELGLDTEERRNSFQIDVDLVKPKSDDQPNRVADPEWSELTLGTSKVYVSEDG